jgi:hypothetical protein
MTLSYRLFWSFDGRRMSLQYLSAGGRYTTERRLTGWNELVKLVEGQAGAIQQRRRARLPIGTP